MTFAYSVTIHETTAYAPFHLMFGCVPWLSVDIVFKSVLHDPLMVDFSSYSKTLLSYLSEAAGITQQHTAKEQKKQASQYNKSRGCLATHRGSSSAHQQGRTGQEKTV